MLAVGELVAVFLLIVAVIGRREAVDIAEARRDRRAARYEDAVLELVCADGDAAPAALTGLRDTADHAAVSRMLTDYAGSVTGTARARLTVFFEESGYVDAAIGDLSRRSEWRRGRAARTLADLASPRAVGPLGRAAVSDRSARVRAAAVRALGRIGGEESADAILAAWVGGRVQSGIAAQALLDVGTPAAATLLVAAGDARSGVRAIACRALGHVGADGRPDVVMQLAARAVDDGDAAVREAACEALGLAGSDDAAFALASAMGDANAGVRRAACDAAARLRISDLQTIASGLTRDSDPRVGRAAARAVAAVRPVPALALPFGREALADRDWRAA
jgi:HEAT repeat protein